MHPRVARIVIALILLSGVLAPYLAQAHTATPDAAALPDATAPLGLGSVTLPADEAAISALFDLLPNAIAGEPESTAAGLERDRIVRAYGTKDPAWTASHPAGSEFQRRRLLPGRFHCCRVRRHGRTGWRFRRHIVWTGWRSGLDSGGNDRRYWGRETGHAGGHATALHPLLGHGRFAVAVYGHDQRSRGA